MTKGKENKLRQFSITLNSGVYLLSSNHRTLHYSDVVTSYILGRKRITGVILVWNIKLTS